MSLVVGDRDDLVLALAVAGVVFDPDCVRQPPTALALAGRSAG
jgi:hypothetical protein